MNTLPRSLFARSSEAHRPTGLTEAMAYGLSGPCRWCCRGPALADAVARPAMAEAVAHLAPTVVVAVTQS